MRDTFSRTGILLVNLGSPKEPSVAAVREYLKEFLSDPYVVPVPRLLWWIILHGWILNTRPAKSAEKYQLIWTNEGAPLIVHSQRQTSLLKGFLGQDGQHPAIALAMRYGKPAIAEMLSSLKEKGCTSILVIPLYPQYASSTTGSIMEVVQTWAKINKDIPKIHVVKDFYDFPPYIEALAQSIRDFWQKNALPDTSSRLLMSFHGMPQKRIDQGDPYLSHCMKTAALLAKRLSLPENTWSVSFQSRFGKGKWLQPDTASVLQSLGERGIKRVDIICPGFISDCLETLEEIAIEGKNTFLSSGGKEFNMIACLNEREDWIHALVELVRTQIKAYL